MRCAAELCPYWTGQGCICEAIGIEPPEPEDDDTGAWQIERSGFQAK